MPPFSGDRTPPTKHRRSVNLNFIDDSVTEEMISVNDENNNNLIAKTTVEKTKLNIKSVKSDEKKKVYRFIGDDEFTIVWKNVIFFGIIHLIHFYGLYKMLSEGHYKLMMFGWVYGLWGGLGVTAGAHRLWSHRAYKAKLPLRIFLMLGHCVAGQNSLFIWCRDHRVHHKYSETDGDPHNSLRGFFFAHMGWLLRKKHPEVIAKGRAVDLEDLQNDPVVQFQKKYYYILYILWAIFIPTALCVYFFNVSWWDAFLQAGVCRYVTSLHCTWFVNSAAHMFGSRPYSHVVKARENIFVSYGAFGEGYHNYHHTFPWDYATSELNYIFNWTKFFIDGMECIGQAYALKRVSRSIIEKRLTKYGHH